MNFFAPDDVIRGQCSPPQTRIAFLKSFKMPFSGTSNFVKNQYFLIRSILFDSYDGGILFNTIKYGENFWANFPFKLKVTKIRFNPLSIFSMCPLGGKGLNRFIYYISVRGYWTIPPFHKLETSPAQGVRTSFWPRFVATVVARSSYPRSRHSLATKRDQIGRFQITCSTQIELNFPNKLNVIQTKRKHKYMTNFSYIENKSFFNSIYLVFEILLNFGWF